MSLHSPITLPDAPLPAPQVWAQLYGASDSQQLAAAAQADARPWLVLAANTRQQERLASEIAFFAPDLPIHLFPAWEILPYDQFSPHADIVSQRLATLATLPTLKHGIAIATVDGALSRLSPRAHVELSQQELAAGQQVDREQLRLQLDQLGYTPVSQVFDPGEFAVRGHLFDIFPTGQTLPLRLDFLDQEIDSIRHFDTETQISTTPVETARLLPAREFPFDEQTVKTFRHNFRRRFDGDPSEVQVYQSISSHTVPPGIEQYLPLFFEDLSCLFDFLPSNTQIATVSEWRDIAQSSWQQIEDRFQDRCGDRLNPLLNPDELFLPPDALEQNLAGFPRIFWQPHKYDQELSTDAEATNFNTRPVPTMSDKSLIDESSTLAWLNQSDSRALMVAETRGRQERIVDWLREHKLSGEIVSDWAAFRDTDHSIAITIADIDRGFLQEDTNFGLITANDLFEQAATRSRRARSRRDPATLLQDMAELELGAPVVHEHYGVGRYSGLTTLEVGGDSSEFLTLTYANDDKIYVPVHALHLITRYIGADADHAPLHQLGTAQWEKAQKKAARAVRDAAAELLELYARRAAQVGQSHALDAKEYRAFADQFPFEETEDQAAAIEAVLDDLTSEKSMDRIVCGDVGFGKTEVALRAAFVAAMDGRQVAILVPTTLLAQQHYRSFSDRFAETPVTVAELSRFRSIKDNRETLEKIKTGKVDVVIGTHKLLQPSVRFSDLGLVIVDEEHRFGVRHKEALKSLRAEVDVLTLTATPIPRTMNQALGGLRDISIIATPPPQRVAIKTFVCQQPDRQDPLIRDACLREFKRGGQVYFVHNRVQTIDKIHDQLQELIPEADIRVAHGQMPERQLEQIMVDFYQRRFNLLLCTTIVESGLDVATANTIVIDRADRLGLAQLHQLRGRVGRAHHRAYAYLLTPPKNQLSGDTQKRLEAIESTEELGAGFMIATHDLEIRGAGELLGEKQSGEIHEVGFSMYLSMLERTVEALKSGNEPDYFKPTAVVDINLGGPAFLPDWYLPDVELRLRLYKRIASQATEQELHELRYEMIDRFGALPPEGDYLFTIATLKLMSQSLGIVKINAHARGGLIEFGEKTAVAPEVLIGLILQDPKVYKLDGSSTLRFRADLPSPEERSDFVGQLIEDLQP